ncbi:DNA mismatch repair protein MutS [Candidatus Babeliales bacterium]|nr:DNA mismatch repair protein MutS [Candidatus Babeliales bacterium]MBP9843970.1 DNA mismatch repair protein MutS [Candidatus Babeliales bacterium]
MDISSLPALTPLMQQYFQLRTQFDDAILLFQVGDFYELFFEDAQKVSSFLGIALTKRGTFNGQPIPLCGFPVHVLDHYVTKLVKGGFKVALCQQLEQAVAGKMVARGVTQVFTPGTLTSETLLDAKASSYLFSFFPMKDAWGLLFSELLTSQLHATVLPIESDRSLEAELYRFLPDEVLLQAQAGMSKFDDFFKQRGFFTTRHKIADESESIETVQNWTEQQFSAKSCAQLAQSPALTHAITLWHSYLSKNQKGALDQFKEINFYSPDQFLLLDGATQKNLDIVANSFDGAKKNSLIACMDKAVTPMGSRMIRRWLLRPLVDVDAITQRQQVVSYFVAHPSLLTQLKRILEQFGDLQRIVGRIALQKASMKDYVQLGVIAGLMPELQILLEQSPVDFLQQLSTTCIDVSKLHRLLTVACNDDELQSWTIRKGFDDHLDYLRDCIAQTDQKLLDLEAAEQKRTGISTLKIRQNNVQGFYIEVTKANSEHVPADYIRQQTLVGRERYTMPILQQMQAQALQANLTIETYEKELFVQVQDQVAQFIVHLRKIAETVATVDALVGFAVVAYDQGYVCPQFNTSRDIIIHEGKHPVIAAQLQHRFIANDTNLTNQESLWIVTGPNMGGKSTYLRQVALISILAQAGSFVPARFASLPILDRIFTRIGAGDNLAEGKSTFLVEMEETAQICLQATARSLVILDEVGRGTSTFDGLALAQAVVEYLYEKVQARCLFATHYHELTYLQDHFPGITTYYADSKQTEQGILFLHKIVKGVARQSFGLQVARLANLPTSVLLRAGQLVTQFEHKDAGQQQLTFLPAQKALVNDQQWEQKCKNLTQQLQQQQALIEKLKQIDCNNLSPKQAFDILWDLQQNRDANK